MAGSERRSKISNQEIIFKGIATSFFSAAAVLITLGLLEMNFLGIISIVIGFGFLIIAAFMKDNVDERWLFAASAVQFLIPRS